MTYFFKILLDDETKDSATEYEVQKAGGEIDPPEEEKCHFISMEDVGEKPMKVNSGTKISVLFRIHSSDYEFRRSYYGDQGRPDDYKQIEGNEEHFEVEASDWNQNGTSLSWGQIPFIHYCKR
jgi:hypothetical protein